MLGKFVISLVCTGAAFNAAAESFSDVASSVLADVFPYLVLVGVIVLGVKIAGAMFSDKEGSGVSRILESLTEDNTANSAYESMKEQTKESVRSSNEKFEQDWQSFERGRQAMREDHIRMRQKMQADAVQSAHINRVLTVLPDISHTVLEDNPKKVDGFIDTYDEKTLKGTIKDARGRVYAFDAHAFCGTGIPSEGRFVHFLYRKVDGYGNNLEVTKFCFDPDRFYKFHESKRQLRAGYRMQCYHCGQYIVPTYHSECRFCGKHFQMPEYVGFDGKKTA